MRLKVWLVLLGVYTLGYSQSEVYQESYGEQWGSIGVALIINSYASYHLSHSSQASKWEEPPFSWDQQYTGHQNANMETASDILPLANLYLLTHSIGRGHVAADLMLYLEVISWNSAINMSVRNLKLWRRPSSHGSHPEELSSESFGSFYSGHASNSFAFATAYTHLQYSREPHNPMNIWWSSLAYGIASLTSTARWYSGKHYPTDIVVGAIAGVGVSWFIMEMRSTSVHLVPTPQGAQLSWQF